MREERTWMVARGAPAPNTCARPSSITVSSPLRRRDSTPETILRATHPITTAVFPDGAGPELP